MDTLFEEMAEKLDDLAGPDTLNAEGVHGALTAWAVTGKSELPDDFDAHVLSDDLGEVSAEDRQTLNTLWAELLNEILTGLYDDSELALPFDTTLQWEDSEQQAWCLGFMEMLFAQEHAFSHVREDALAEVLLPIQVGSGLFMQEAEFRDIYKDDALLASLLQQIPEVLVDLYLLCNAPE